MTDLEERIARHVYRAMCWGHPHQHPPFDAVKNTHAKIEARAVAKDILNEIKAITAERDILQARVAELEGALTKVQQEGHSDTCSTVLSDAFFHPCDCHVGIARQVLKENQDD